MATQEIYTDLTLKGNEIKDARVENVTSLPEGTKGRLVYLTADDNPGFYYFDGADWVCVGTKTAEKALADRLTVVEAATGTGGSAPGESLADKITALRTDVDKNKADIATNKSGVADNKKDIAAVKTTADNAAAAIVTINDTIGDDATADSVKGRIKALETTSATDTGRISALEGFVGASDTAGLRGKVATLEATVGGADSGLVKDVADLQTDVAKKANSADVYAKGDVDTKIKAVDDKVTANTTAIEAINNAGYLKASVAETTYRTIADSYSQTEIDGKITAAVSSAYQVKGTKTYAQLASAEKANGYVYNVSDPFAYDGENYPAGTNVVWVGDAETGKWDPLAGVTDLSAYSTTTDMNTAIDNKIKAAGHATTEALADGLALKVDKTITVNGQSLSANVTLDKDDVGLGSVENTADADKPVSTATQTALDKKVDKLTVSPAGTYAKVTVNADGQVTSGADLAVEDLPTLAAKDITDFNAKAVAAGRIQATVNMVVNEAFQDTGITGLSAYPSAVTVYNPDGQIVFVAIKYDSTSKKLMYQTNVALNATVVVSL